MYASFFGLKREPFSIAPDPRALFMSERHREALAHLLYGLNAGGGFVLLTGEIGAGKTTVCRCFLEQVPKRCNVAYIFNPKLTVEELLRTVCDEFGVPPPVATTGSSAPTVKDYVDPLNRYLLKTHAVGQNNVLIIDEAQNLSAEVLEQLRLLTNLETSERKLLQVVLIGQPELRDKLAQPGLEQLAQRVVARFHLDALSAAETAQYIAHRLSVAGMTGANPFEAAAVRQIHRLTGGVPRRINLLCDRALLGAYASAAPRIDRHIVETAATEVFGDGRRVTASARGDGSRIRLVAAWSVAGGLMAGAGLVGVAMSARQAPAVAADAPIGASARQSTAAAPASSVASPGSTHSVGAAAAASGTARSTGPLAAAAASGGALPMSADPGRGSASSNSLSSAGNSSPTAAERASAAATVIETAALFARLPRSEAEAWRALAPMWQLALGDGEPCAAAARQQSPCFRGNVEPALIRRLDRPGILTLHDDAGHTAYALLVGFSSTTALLRLPVATGGGTDNSVRSMPLVTLARLWRGDFATFWRAPPGYAGNLANGSAGPAVDWLAQRLAALRREPPTSAAQTFDESLRARLVAFQLANELRPDGIAGPTTLMLINRAGGVDEPRLLPVAALPASATVTAS